MRFIDAYNRRDVDALLEELDPAVEWRPALPLLLGEATVYRGHEGARAWLRSLNDVLDEASVEYSEIRILATGSWRSARCAHAARGAERRPTRPLPT